MKFLIKTINHIRNSLLILILFSSIALAVGNPSSKYDGAKQFWDDVKSVLVKKKDARSLKGYTE